MSKLAIIGDGVAGCFLAWHCYLKNIDFTWVGDSEPTSSRLAAGVINPVIGRKFNPTWKYEILLRALNSIIDSIPVSGVLQKHELYRSISTQSEYNEFSLRKHELEKSGYLREIDHSAVDNDWNIDPIAWTCINASRLDLKKLLDQSVAFFKKESRYVSRYINLDKRCTTRNYHLDRLNAECYVISNGASPWEGFNFNIGVTKQRGELIIFHSKHLSEKYLLKHQYFVVPLGNQYFWLGSNYEWDEMAPVPTNLEYSKMENFLTNHLKGGFEIVQHSVGFRPTVYDRMPIIGRHKDYSNLYFLNGLGSRGSILAPYCSEILLEYIFEGKALPSEVDINRFYNHPKF